MNGNRKKAGSFRSIALGLLLSFFIGKAVAQAPGEPGVRIVLDSGSLRKLVDIHLDAWNEVDPGIRRAKLGKVYSQDVSFIDPSLETNGLGKMDQFISALQKENPAYKFTLDRYDNNHDVVRLFWKFGPAGNPDLVSGMDLMVIGNGKIRSLRVFPDHVQGAKGDLSDDALVRALRGFRNGSATVNGIRLHYVIGGAGKPLVLLPGWPQTWWEYRKMMEELAKKYTVLVVDYRGMGSSDKPEGGYDKKTIAGDLNGLLAMLGYNKVYVAGHDIGSQVAYSLAANYPERVEKLIMMDVPHPDESFVTIPMLPALGTSIDTLDPGKPYVWWFAFNQLSFLPQELVAGRARTFQNVVFHYLLKDDSSILAFDRDVYAAAYNTADAIRAGNGWYRAFPQDIADSKTYSKLTMPVLGIGGPGYGWLQYALPPKTTLLKLVPVRGSGHFIPEEQPQAAISAIEEFLK